MEEYSGVKFRTLFLGKDILQFPQIEELKRWGKKLSELGFIPHYRNEKETDRLSSAGNLSFRYNNRFIITASYSDLADLRDEDFVKIEKVDLRQKKIWANGVRNPSSETMLHFAIYQKRAEINTIFHGHSSELLENYQNLGLKSTLYQAPYGSLKLVNSVLEVLNEENFLIMKNHGFLCLGKTTNIAGQIIVEINQRLRNII